MKCTNCGREKVFFGDICSYCGTRNHDNNQSLDGFWGRFSSKQP
ncbi:putative OB-fold protein [Hymenobacter sp. UYP22]